MSAPLGVPVGAPPGHLVAMGPALSPGESPQGTTSVLSRPDTPWVTIVWNDPVNLMSYVTFVFMTYFGYSEDVAARLMRDVHTKGRAVVSNGTMEEMERDTEALHGFGLWATFTHDTGDGA